MINSAISISDHALTCTSMSYYYNKLEADSNITDLESTITEQKIIIFESEQAIRDSLPRFIAKLPPTSGKCALAWPTWVVETIMGMLSH